MATSRQHCCIPNCSQYRALYPDAGVKISYFRFPSNKERCQVWIQSIQNYFPNFVYEKTWHTVCSMHFTDINFGSTLKSRLLKFAVPDIFLSVDKSNVTNSLELLGPEINPVGSFSFPEVTLDETVDGAKNFRRKLNFNNESSSQEMPPNEEDSVTASGRILKKIGARTVASLTPRKKYLYCISKQQKNQIYKLKNSLVKSTNPIKGSSKNYKY